MVQRFVGASRCSIWAHRADLNQLQRVAHLGGEDGEEVATTIPDDTTIEGWVVRNNLVFSVKMLLENEALARLGVGTQHHHPAHHGRPADLGRSEYRRDAFCQVQPLHGTSAPDDHGPGRPVLERAIEYESVIRQEDINPVTGLPSFSQFYTLLEHERARLREENGTLAVLVLELANFPALAAEHGREHAVKLLAEVASLLLELSGGRARVFHYKAESQLALLYPSLDADGASLFSLTLLGRMNEKEWRLRDIRVRSGIILGFCRAPGRTSPRTSCSKRPRTCSKCRRCNGARLRLLPPPPSGFHAAHSRGGLARDRRRACSPRSTSCT